MEVRELFVYLIVTIPLRGSFVQLIKAEALVSN